MCSQVHGSTVHEKLFLRSLRNYEILTYLSDVLEILVCLSIIINSNKPKFFHKYIQIQNFKGADAEQGERKKFPTVQEYLAQKPSQIERRESEDED